MVIDILDVKELMADVMKSAVKMEHPPGRIITANYYCWRGDICFVYVSRTPTFYSSVLYCSHEAVIGT